MEFRLAACSIAPKSAHTEQGSVLRSKLTMKTETGQCTAFATLARFFFLFPYSTLLVGVNL